GPGAASRHGDLFVEGRPPPAPGPGPTGRRRGDRPSAVSAAAARTGDRGLLDEAAALGALATMVGDLAPVLAQGPGLMRDDLPDDMTRTVAASAVSAAAAVTGRTELLDEAAGVGGLSSDRVPTSIPGFGLADLQVLGHCLAGTPDRVDEPGRRMPAASVDLQGPAAAADGPRAGDRRQDTGGASRSSR
ncbi:MAG: hypothetical protein ACXWDM_10415, partial [Nocardioides sp.]